MYVQGAEWPGCVIECLSQVWAENQNLSILNRVSSGDTTSLDTIL